MTHFCRAFEQNTRHPSQYYNVPCVIKGLFGSKMWDPKCGLRSCIKKLYLSSAMWIGENALAIHVHVPLCVTTRLLIFLPWVYTRRSMNLVMLNKTSDILNLKYQSQELFSKLPIIPTRARTISKMMETVSVSYYNFPINYL
uniref:Uncharacterized protein n=1 Tax=Opuntia streptacantha TaxID=393608 RepID=A0A7C9DTX1_OPUST